MKRSVIILAGLFLAAGLQACGADDRDRPEKPVVMNVPEPPGLPDGANPNEFLVGKSVSDFPDSGLVNESGQPVSFGSLPDKPVLMSFIYVNCPDAQMCPLITYKMRQVQKRMNQEDRKPVYFVSVTFDPKNDTPGALRRYGDKRGINYENWDFWTGDPETIRQLTQEFKILTTKVPDQATDTEATVLNHNMRTYLLDENRVVRYWYPGSDWKATDVSERLRGMIGDEVSWTRW